MKKTTSDTVLDEVSCDVSSIHQNANLQSVNSFLSASSSTPIHQKSSNKQSQLMTPKTANIFMLQEKLAKANDRIHELEIVQTNISSSSLSLPFTPKSARIEMLTGDLIATKKITSQLHKENISWRHKFMDTRGKMRTFCRIKPQETGDRFEWQCNDTNIQICIHIFLTNSFNITINICFFQCQIIILWTIFSGQKIQTKMFLI